MGSEALGLSSRAVVGRILHRLETGFDQIWPGKLGLYVPSDQASETYKWLGQAPAMREWVGGRQAKGLRSNGITVANKKFEATIEIDEADFRRDKTAQIMSRVDDLARRANQHWAKLLTALITGNGTCYDAQAFFSATHSEGDSGTLLNLLAAGQVASLNMSTPPTEAEMAKCIMDVIAYMLAYVDDQKEPFHEDAAEWLIVTPVALLGPILAACTKDILNTGSGTTNNILKNTNWKVSCQANPRLDATSTTVFYVFRTDGSAKPFILQEEVAPKIVTLAEGSEYAKLNGKYLFSVEAVRNVGFAYWQYAAHCTSS